MFPKIYRTPAVWFRMGLQAGQITFVGRGAGSPVEQAPWNPGVANLPEFGVPIGGPDSPVAGTRVGERWAPDLLTEGIRDGLFPLPTDYVLTDHDRDLFELVAIPSAGNLPAWDALVAPVLKMAGIVPEGGTAATGPASSLGAPGMPHGTTPPSPPPAPSVVQAPPVTAQIPPVTAAQLPPLNLPQGADPGLSAADISSIVTTLKRGYPSRGTEIDIAAAALQSRCNTKPVEIIAALLPVLGVTDPRVTRALGIIELFLE